MIDFIMIFFNAPRKGWSGFKIQKETDLKFETMETNVVKTILAHFEEYFVDFFLTYGRYCSVLSSHRNLSELFLCGLSIGSTSTLHVNDVVLRIAQVSALRSISVVLVKIL